MIDLRNYSRRSFAMIQVGVRVGENGREPVLATREIGKGAEPEGPAQLCPEEESRGFTGERQTAREKAAASSYGERMNPALRLITGGRGMESDSRRIPGHPAPALSRPMLHIVGGMDHASTSSG